MQLQENNIVRLKREIPKEMHRPVKIMRGIFQLTEKIEEGGSPFLLKDLMTQYKLLMVYKLRLVTKFEDEVRNRLKGEKREEDEQREDVLEPVANDFREKVKKIDENFGDVPKMEMNDSNIAMLVFDPYYEVYVTYLALDSAIDQVKSGEGSWRKVRKGIKEKKKDLLKKKKDMKEMLDFKKRGYADEGFDPYLQKLELNRIQESADFDSINDYENMVSDLEDLASKKDRILDSLKPVFAANIVLISGIEESAIEEEEEEMEF